MLHQIGYAGFLVVMSGVLGITLVSFVHHRVYNEYPRPRKRHSYHWWPTTCDWKPRDE